MIINPNMKQKPLQDKIALVTGAARGIGLAIAKRLAEDGADVAALDLPSMNLEACVQAIKANGQRALPISGDVTVSADWENALQQIIEHFGQLDILVNNAGISGPISPIMNYPDETFDRVMAVNARSVFLGMKYAAKQMQTRGGAIVNIASVSGLSGSRGILAYTASKHAVIGMTKVAALEFAAHKIRVNAVCPAPTDTKMVQTLENTLSPDNPELTRKRLFASIPLGRYGDPAEIAATVAFLASAESSFMTGSALVVDGGMIAS